jgi:hypothetical protein
MTGNYCDAFNIFDVLVFLAGPAKFYECIVMQLSASKLSELVKCLLEHVLIDTTRDGRYRFESSLTIRELREFLRRPGTSTKQSPNRIVIQSL